MYRNRFKVYEGHTCDLVTGLVALGIPYHLEDVTNWLDDIGMPKEGFTEPFPEEL